MRKSPKNRILVGLAAAAFVLAIGAVGSPEAHAADAISFEKSTLPTAQFGKYYSERVNILGGTGGRYDIEINSLQEASLRSLGFEFEAGYDSASDTNYFTISGDPADNKSLSPIVITASDGNETATLTTGITVNPIRVDFQVSNPVVMYDGQGHFPDASAVSISPSSGLTDKDGNERGPQYLAEVLAWTRENANFSVRLKYGSTYVSEAVEVGYYYSNISVLEPGFRWNATRPTRTFRIAKMEGASLEFSAAAYTIPKSSLTGYSLDVGTAEGSGTELIALPAEAVKAGQPAIPDDVSISVGGIFEGETETTVRTVDLGTERKLYLSRAAALANGSSKYVDGLMEGRRYTLFAQAGQSTSYEIVSARATVIVVGDAIYSSEDGNSIAANIAKAGGNASDFANAGHRAIYDSETETYTASSSGIYYSPEAWGDTSSYDFTNLDEDEDAYFIFADPDPEVYSTRAAYDESIKEKIRPLETVKYGEEGQTQRANSIAIRAVDSEEDAESLADWAPEDGVYEVEYTFVNPYVNAGAETKRLRTVVLLSKRAGDVNGDRNVNIADVNYAANYSSENASGKGLIALAAGTPSAAERLLLYRVFDVAAAYGSIDASDLKAIGAHRLSPIALHYYSL